MSQTDCSNDNAPYFNAFRPSEYTAAMVHVLEEDCKGLRLDCVMDIGVGAGVFLAVLARLGAKELHGVDIAAEAVQASTALLAFEAPACQVSIRVGDMWEYVPKNMRFDVIVANVPHFPAKIARGEGRPDSWSGAGSDLLLRYLEGLPNHLSDSGFAYMTLSDIVGAEHVFRRITDLGLEYKTVFMWTSTEPRERMQSVSDAWVKEESTSFRSYGGYHFLHARILKINKLSKVSR